MNFRELLTYNLENPKDLTYLEKHKFTTSEVLGLIKELTYLRNPEIGQKKDYLTMLRNCKAHSQVTVEKYADHLKRQ